VRERELTHVQTRRGFCFLHKNRDPARRPLNNGAIQQKRYNPERTEPQEIESQPKESGAGNGMISLKTKTLLKRLKRAHIKNNNDTSKNNFGEAREERRGIAFLLCRGEQTGITQGKQKGS